MGKGRLTAPHSGPGRSGCLVVVEKGKLASDSREIPPSEVRKNPATATLESTKTDRHENQLLLWLIVFEIRESTEMAITGRTLESMRAETIVG